MAHFNITWLGGLTDLSVPSAAEWTELDTKTSKSINGDEGGTWAPSSPIIIGGSGLTLPSLVQWQINGSLRVKSAGEIFAESGSNVRYDGGSFVDMGADMAVRADGSYLGKLRVKSGGQLLIESTAGTCTISKSITVDSAAVVSFATNSGIRANGQDLVINDATDIKFSPARSSQRTQTLHAAVLGSGWAYGFGQNLIMAGTGTSAEISLTDLHNGANLTSVKLTVQGVAHPGGSPSNPPLMRVARLNVFTGVETFLMSSAYDMTALTVGAALHNAQVPMDQNQTIDRSAYVYYMKLTSESGTNAVPNAFFYPPALVHDGISDMRFR